MSEYVLQEVTAETFKKYGKIIDGYDCTKLLEAMGDTPLPGDVIYEPSIKELENLDVSKKFEKNFYGGLPIQVGYCNGSNEYLTALEYHRSSEINVAVTDMVLLIGRQQDIKDDFTYDTDLAEAFLVRKGQVVEMYATTLHYAPCNYEGKPFKCVVVLPKDTNTELEAFEKITLEDKYLTAKNKWLIEF
ncbi:MAG: DUF4867 family protein [Lachnospiraceae bacterium]|nr:DUF4867 family protein [Lachnospiraceae bacterium]